jgi:hypothetical protein
VVNCKSLIRPAAPRRCRGGRPHRRCRYLLFSVGRRSPCCAPQPHRRRPSLAGHRGGEAGPAHPGTPRGTRPADRDAGPANLPQAVVFAQVGRKGLLPSAYGTSAGSSKRLGSVVSRPPGCRGLRRVPLPTRSDHADHSLVAALRTVLPRCRGTARRAWQQGRSRACIGGFNGSPRCPSTPPSPAATPRAIGGSSTRPRSPVGGSSRGAGVGVTPRAPRWPPRPLSGCQSS